MQFKKNFLMSALIWFSPAPLLQAKGLDELSDQNPETAEPAAEGAESAATEEAPATAQTGPVERSAASKAISQKLFMETSFGWALASKSKGDWKGSGMSDVLVGYHIMAISPVMNLSGTYRYAPIAVTGTEDEQSYRGVWETHYFGGRVHYKISQSLRAVGSGEAGYVMVYLNPVDGLETDKKHEANGVSVALGGGADWTLAGDNSFAAGPRIYAGFGSFTTFQIAGAASFLF